MKRFLFLALMIATPALAGASLSQSLTPLNALACPGVFLRDVVHDGNDIIAHRAGDVADFEGIIHHAGGGGLVIESNTMGESFSANDVRLFDCVEMNCKPLFGGKSCDLGNKAFKCMHVAKGLHVAGGFMCDKVGKR